MKPTLALAKGLALPLAAVTEKLAWLGVTGSGKSYGATKLAELFWHAGAQFVALDPVGTWYGLRLAKDGKSPSDITVPVFGGLHGDVPIEPTGGALLADLIVDRTLSCVIDVSQFESDADKARFAQAFIARLFFRKKAAPSALHLFIEECQEFVPQNPQRGEERMLHEFIRTQKLGRNFGIGSSYISQRPQEVNKKALNMAQTLFAFRTTGTHERKAIADWMADKSVKQDLANDLPKLATGTCHLWSPEFLKISETARILEKATFNASATPEVGAAAKVRTLAPIDLEKVRTDMAATIERAKADDPAHLKKRIAELEKAARALPPAGVMTKAEIKLGMDRAAEARKAAYHDGYEDGAQTTHVAVMNAVLQAIAPIRKSMADASETLLRSMQQIPKLKVKPTYTITTRTRETVMPTPPGTPSAPPATIAPNRPVTIAKLPIAEPKPRGEFRITGINAEGGISAGMQKVMNAMAELLALGVEEPSRVQLGLFAGYDLTGGSGSRYVASLIVAGLAEIGTPGALRLTTSGRDCADQANAPQSLEELHARIATKLSAGELKILKHLIGIYPTAISRVDLGAEVGYDLTGGSGSRYVADLVKIGAIEIPKSGHLVASDLLFPKTLQ